MAKYRVLFICLFGLLCFKTSTSGQQYAPDPSLEEIKNMDAQEGLPRDYIPNKSKDNSIDEFHDKGQYDRTEITDTHKVPSSLIDNKTIKDKWDKELKKRNIVNEFDEKDNAIQVPGNKFAGGEETLIQAEEEMGQYETETTNQKTDILRGHVSNSESNINSENTIGSEEPETETEQHRQNEESESKPQTLTDTNQETEEEIEPSLEESEYETKIDMQPVLEFNEDSVHYNVAKFDPTEEEFEILTEENETDNEVEEEPENNNVEHEVGEVEEVEVADAETEVDNENDQRETANEVEEEPDNDIEEYDEGEIEETEVSHEEMEAVEEEMETENEPEFELEEEEVESDNTLNEYDQTEELQTEIEEEEPRTEEIEVEELVEYDEVRNNENEDNEYEIYEEEIETEAEDSTTDKSTNTNEAENESEEQASMSANAESYDTEAEPNGFDSNIAVPQFMTDFHLQQKDPEIAVNSYPVEKMDPACHLPPVTGFCKAAFRRFYFNSETGECQTFIFGGCGGNENNFETMEECMKTCSKVRV